MSFPLRFPTAPIAPSEDLTERAMSRAFDVAGDFVQAIRDTDSVNRTLQLAERLRAVIGTLEAVYGDAMDKADAILKGQD